MTQNGAGRIDELLEEAVASGAVPGVVAIVVDRDGVVYEGAAGSLDVEGGAPATADTMFRIASMTKALATIGVLQLVEDGRLDLDGPVSPILPAFGELQVLEGFDNEDAPILRPAGRDATIRQLLSHTAGLGYFFTNEDLRRWHEQTDTPTVLSFTKRFLEAPLIDDPGNRWEYSTAVDWAGQVLEALTGQTLDAYLAEHLFTPLGMTDTTFRAGDEQRSRTMAIHARTPEGGLATTELDWPPDPEMACGGHGAFGTARDYGRFMRMLLRNGELDGTRVLSSELVDEALSPNIGDVPLPDLIRSADPMLSNDIPKLPFEQTWGLGFHLTLEDVPGMRRSGTGDWAGICNCYYWIDRTSGIAAAFMTQVLPFFDAAIIGNLMAFEQAVYAEVGVPAAV